MIAFTESFVVLTRGKGTYEITEQVAALPARCGIKTGLATVFVQHTSASLVIYENADPTARTDLHRFFEDLVPEDHPGLIHTAEGADDSTSHLRMALTRTSDSIPIAEGRLQLGTWQGIYLFEHRRAPNRRTIVVSLIGN
ncbi:MAG: secondary thiamine-phosphate synthase enzyme YjbQ [Verrucomicrobiota bacterium]